MTEVLLLQVCMGVALIMLAVIDDDVVWGSAHLDTTSRWRIDPNIATEAELRLLPGVGVARSRSIMEMRASVGLFTADHPLVDVPGLGQGLLRRWVESDLLDVPAGAIGVRLKHEP